MSSELRLLTTYREPRVLTGVLATAKPARFVVTFAYLDILQ